MGHTKKKKKKMLEKIFISFDAVEPSSLRMHHHQSILFGSAIMNNGTEILAAHR